MNEAGRSWISFIWSLKKYNSVFKKRKTNPPYTHSVMDLGENILTWEGVRHACSLFMCIHVFWFTHITSYNTVICCIYIFSLVIYLTNF